MGLRGCINPKGSNSLGYCRYRVERLDRICASTDFAGKRLCPHFNGVFAGFIERLNIKKEVKHHEDTMDYLLFVAGDDLGRASDCNTIFNL